MRIRQVRLLTLAAAVLALALPTAGLAAPRGGKVDRGVVQSVDASRIVLRALDGTTVSFDVGPRVNVRLNGARATLADVAPGYVADVTADSRGRAVLIVAYGTPAGVVTERGVVVTVTRTSLELTTADGGSRTFALDRNTRFRLLGAPTKRTVVRPGVVVAVTHAGAGTAQVVNVLKRPRA